MGDCHDEAEACKLLKELTRAEEVVTIKRIREPRLQADLAELLTDTEKACNAAHSEATRGLGETPQEAVSSFWEVMHDARYPDELAKRRQATEGLLLAIKLRTMADRQQTNLSSARRAVAMTSEPLATRQEGLKSALALLDRAHTAHAEIADETKRLTAACAAFRKVYTKD